MTSKIPIGGHGAISGKQQPDGSWRYSTRYRDVDGKLRPVNAYGPGKRAQEQRLLQKLRERTNPSQLDLTVDSKFPLLVERWRRESEQRVATGKVKEQYVAEQERQLRKWLMPAFEELTLRQITADRLAQYFDRIRPEARNETRNIRSLMSRILAVAVRYGLYPVNPVAGTLPETPAKKEPKALSIEDALRLRGHSRAFRTGPGVMGPPPTSELPDIIDFMLGTGARIGEALAIRWRDLVLTGPLPTAEFNGTVVYVKRKGYFRQEFTKSSAGERTVSLPPFLVEVLRRRGKNRASSEWVFPAANGNLRQTQNVHRAWRSMRKGTEWEWVTPHTFRKTVATLLDANVDTATAAKQLGHASEEITRRYYVAPSNLAPDTSHILEQLGTVTHLAGAAHPEVEGDEEAAGM
ncbi:tyrosine-type recombinase/integrase [Lysobacter korlensis]|uniref:Tyrosine-type recombinase/integrase n=1 Tax=Lysobacter korlensis TaxID=553636 RepID=A0ABV6RMX1_9GAMM